MYVLETNWYCWVFDDRCHSKEVPTMLCIARQTHTGTSIVMKNAIYVWNITKEPVFVLAEKDGWEWIFLLLCSRAWNIEKYKKVMMPFFLPFCKKRLSWSTIVEHSVYSWKRLMFIFSLPSDQYFVIHQKKWQKKCEWKVYTCVCLAAPDTCKTDKSFFWAALQKICQ